MASFKIHPKFSKLKHLKVHFYLILDVLKVNFLIMTSYCFTSRGVVFKLLQCHFPFD